METSNKAAVQPPKYAEIAAAIKAEILTGRIGENERLASFAELKTRYGATPTTANQVYGLLEREGLISRERGRGIFVRRVRREGTGIIALPGTAFETSHRLPYWDDLFRGAEKAAAEAGFEILIVKPGSNSIHRDKVDGILLAGHAEGSMPMPPPDLPCVSLLVRRDGMSSVAVDDYWAMRAVVDYLIQLGHRKIAFLYEGVIGPLTRPRHHAVNDSLAEAGIVMHPRWARSVPMPLPFPSDFRAGGKQTMAAWLREDWRELGCTALVAINDETALGALDALLEAKVRVPEEVSVAGFDGIDARDHALPLLTTAQIPLRKIGAVGMEILLRQVRSESGPPTPACVLLPTQLRIGETTAPPR